MSLNSVEQNDLLEFGPFRLDARARLLLRDGIPVPIPPKSYETLVYLIRNRGRAVPREELCAAVWPDVVVSDGSLTQAVFLIRKALGESEEGPTYVETVPRVGYRFMADVRETAAVPATSSPAAKPMPRPEKPDRPAAGRRVPIALLAGSAFVLGILCAAVVWTLRRPAAPRSQSPPRPAPASGLLHMRRELPIPPDATAILGHVDTSFVLGAPGAYYLLRDDGALAPTRIPLAAGETLAGLAEDALVVIRQGAAVSRDPIKQTDKAPSRLPAGLPVSSGRWLASPDGRFLALRSAGSIEVLERREDRCLPAFRVTVPARPDEVLALGTRYLVLASGGGEPLRIYSLADRGLVREAPCPELRIGALAIDDVSGRVAVGGAFDAIHVLTIGGDAPAVRLPRHGWTHGLAFVPDAPTLIASGYYGVAAFRESAVLQDTPDVAAAGTVLPVPGGVLVFSTKRLRLTWLDYAGFPPAARVDAKAAIFWAVEHDASGKMVFAGGRDGKLYALDVATSRLTSTAVHTDGIPSLLREGGFLASASDDKTVAVWELPGPRLVRRSTAHRFLVNDLQVAHEAPGGPTLVTSSSDGTVKTWSWPTLEPRESIDVGALAGKASELHALWVAPDLSRILAGTWDGALLDLTKSGSRWSARRLPVRSGAVYRLAALPKLGVVAGVGIYPHEVFVFDLASGTVHPLESAGLPAYWCAADAERSELTVVGDGGVLRYAFERGGGEGARGRTLRYDLVARRQSDLGLMSVTLLPDGSVWAATDDGALVRFAPGSLAGPPSASGRVELPADAAR